MLVRLIVCLQFFLVVFASCSTDTPVESREINKAEEDYRQKMIENIDNEIQSYRLDTISNEILLPKENIKLNLYDKSNVFICDTFSIAGLDASALSLARMSHVQLHKDFFTYENVLNLNRYLYQREEYLSVFKEIEKREYLLVTKQYPLNSVSLVSSNDFKGFTMLTRLFLLHRKKHEIIAMSSFVTSNSTKLSLTEQPDYNSIYASNSIEIGRDFLENYRINLNDHLKKFASLDFNYE